MRKESHEYITSKDQSGYTALYLVVWNMHIEAVKLLESAVPSSRWLFHDEDGSTYLRFAVWNNDVEVVKMLLDAFDTDRLALIRWAAETGQFYGTKALIEAGMCISTAVESYRTRADA